MEILSRFLRRKAPREDSGGVMIPGEVVAIKEIRPGDKPADVLKELAEGGDGVVAAIIGFGSVKLVTASSRFWSKAVFVNGEYIDPFVPTAS